MREITAIVHPPLKELRAILYNHLAMRDMNLSAKIRVFGRFARFYEKNVSENFDFVERKTPIVVQIFYYEL